MDLIQNLKTVYDGIDQEPIGQKKTQIRIRKGMTRMDKKTEKLLKKLNRDGVFYKMQDAVEDFMMKKSMKKFRRNMDKNTRKFCKKIGELGPISTED
jgi:predicted SAM-dependent methyltransferase